MKHRKHASILFGLILGLLGGALAPTAGAMDEGSLESILGHDSEGAALEIRGDVRAFWRTQHEITPLSKGTFRFARDAKGGRVLVLEMPVLAHIEYGANAAHVWEVDPVAGPQILTGESAKTLRRLLAAIEGGTCWKAAYESAARDGDGFRMSPSDDPGDLWKVSDGRLSHAELTHRNGRGEALRLSLEIGDWKGQGRDAYPGRVTLDREHNRFTLEAKDVKRGDVAAVAPAAELMARVESRKKAGPDSPELVTLAEVPVASIRSKVSMAEISGALGEMLPAILFACQQQGIAPIGAPYTRYHSMEGMTADIEVGFPVASKVKGTDRIKASTLPAGRVATTWHVGPYHTLGQTHTRLMTWVSEQGMMPGGAPWEIYWTDPGLEADPGKWRTQIVLPVRSK